VRILHPFDGLSPDLLLIGGDGPKLIDLLQMREKHLLQDRIELLGPIRHKDVLSVLSRGQIFMNTSLTEAFGIAILEAACAGLYVVSTRVGGVPEILPEDMISFAEPEEDGKYLVPAPPLFSEHPATDVIRAISEAICIVRQGKHDPFRAHERIKTLYNWEEVTARTERVYDTVLKSRQIELMERIERCVSPLFREFEFALTGPLTCDRRTMSLGPFAGLIYTIILLVACVFFLFLEWWMPRESLHHVHHHWEHDIFQEVCSDFNRLPWC